MGRPPPADAPQTATEVLESISDAFFALDRDWRFTYLNTAAERLLLRTRAGLIGRNVWEEFPAAVGSTFEAEYRRAAADRVTVQFEAYYPPPLDSWYTVRAYPTSTGLAVYFQTDNERRRQADLLRESEERYRTLFEAIDEGFCVVEFLDGPHGPLSDYVHVLANPAFAANTGIPDVVGRRVRELVPDEADGWVEVYRGVLLTGRAVRFERELAAGGRHLELAAFRVEPPDRRQVAVLFKDVTARKEAEEKVRDADRRKDEFLATLAHELRNPLAPLRNGLQVLRLAGGRRPAVEQTRAHDGAAVRAHWCGWWTT
jgi:PAS domain S-box-containing protein